MTALQAMKAAVFLKSIACTFPPLGTRRCKLASVLDLEQYHPSRYYPQVSPYSGPPDDTDVNLSIRCQCRLKIRRSNTETVLDDVIFLAFKPIMVGRGGLEPPTSRLSGARSNHLSYRPDSFLGGAYRDRTDDLLNANQALSQLS